MPTLDTAIALVALQDVKDFLTISGSTEDSKLTYLINEVSRWIASFCGRNFVSTTYTEYYDGTGTDELMLKNYPIISVTSLHDDPARVFGSNVAKSVAADVLVYKNTGTLKLWNKEGAFQVGVANVKVVYVAGYAPIPAEIQMACKRLIAVLYLRQTNRNFDIQSQTVQQQTTSYLISDMPPNVKAILNGYRKLDRQQGGLE